MASPHRGRQIGGFPLSVQIAPAAVIAAGANIALPTNYPKIASEGGSATVHSGLIGAQLLRLTGGDFGVVATYTPATFAAGAPVAGQIMQVDESNVKIADATAATDLIILVYITAPPQASVTYA